MVLIIVEKIYKNLQKNWLIYLILLFALSIRLFKLSEYPPILNRDEAALAYNAKLILEAGRDETGKLFPFQFESFGDYKLPGYIYSLVFFFSIFGESDFVVRLPSVLAGVGIVWMGALLIVELGEFKNTKYAFLFSLCLLSLTPVFFFYSRMAWEANLSLFFFLSALLFTFKKTKKRLLFDFFSALMLLFAILTYNSPLLLFPFILPAIIIYRKHYSPKKWTFSFFWWFLVLVIGGIIFASVAMQKSSITIFSDETLTLSYADYRVLFPLALQSIIGNKYAYWLTIMFKNLLSTFSIKFLVTEGGSHPWHSILGRGHLYWIEYVGFLTGVFFYFHKMVIKLFKRDFVRIYRLLIPLYLLLLSSLPSIITVDSPHATRSLFSFIMIMFFVVYGVEKIYLFLRNNISKKIFLIMLGTVIAVEVGVYGYQYFMVWYKQFPTQFNVGFDNILLQSQHEFPLEDKLVIDDEGYNYILAAWYLKMPANIFFATINKHLPDTIGLRYGYQIENYRFVKSLDDRIESEHVVLLKRNNIWGMEKFQ